MTILPEAAKAYIGLTTDTLLACEHVERGAVRRYAQAIMDEDLMFRENNERNARYGGAVAPLIFPVDMFHWRDFGADDPLQTHASDPDYDGSSAWTGGLPNIEPLKHLASLNGGAEMEFFQYARHGDTVKLRARYVDIVEKITSKGPIVLVISEREYFNGNDELLLRARLTNIRRPAGKGA